jgi:hypothetical protein
MAMFVFAALTVIALTIAWATVAIALRQPPQEQVTMVEAGPETGWSITPAHVRLW